MLNRKHNLKSGKSKDKKKGFETEKQDRKPKERENISGKKEIAIEYFDVFLIMKQKQWRKKRKETDKNKKQKESKEERQEGRKIKTRDKRETEKEKQKKGEAKKG